MLKKYKNQLVAIIDEVKYPVERFEFLSEVHNNTGSITSIQVKNSQLLFEIHQSAGSYDAFNLYFSKFEPIPTLKKINTQDYNFYFSDVTRQFKHWLNVHVRNKFEEIDAPDLWSLNINRATIGEPVSDERFTQEEKVVTIKALNDFRDHVLNTIEASTQQQEELNKKIEYLIGAVDRLGKYDWKNTSFSIMYSIIINLAVDTNTARELWDYFIGLFIPHLP